jgi:hypothetical protein
VTVANGPGADGSAAGHAPIVHGAPASAAPPPAPVAPPAAVPAAPPAPPPGAGELLHAASAATASARPTFQVEALAEGVMVASLGGPGYGPSIQPNR